jgi:hypothetical protein
VRGRVGALAGAARDRGGGEQGDEQRCGERGRDDARSREGEAVDCESLRSAAARAGGAGANVPTIAPDRKRDRALAARVPSP